MGSWRWLVCWFFVLPVQSLAGGYTVARDVVWAQGEGYKLAADIYRPESAGLAPAVLMIHGGGWAAGRRQELDWFGRHFAEHGILAISVDYRLAKLGLRDGSVCLADVRAATQALLDHADELRVDRTRLAVLGGSAGGHLAAMLATEQQNPFKAAIILWGPTDLTISPDAMTPRQRGMVTQFLGGAINPELARSASPYWRVTAGITPHWLLIHGARDLAVPVAQSQSFAQRLREQGLDVTFLELPTEGHGVVHKDSGQESLRVLGGFLRRVF